MPAEKARLRRSEQSLEGLSEDVKSVKKHKKQKSGKEKKRTRKHEGVELKDVRESPAEFGDDVGDVIAMEKPEKKKNGGDDGGERINREKVDEPSVSAAEETPKKKKKKKKDRKVQDFSEHTSEKNQPTLKKESAEAIARSDMERAEGPAKESEYPEPEKKRKKKKKNRKSANHSEEGQDEKLAVEDKEVANTNKDPQSENVKRQDGPSDDPDADEQARKKDLGDSTDAAKSQHQEGSPSNAEQKGKKRKREGQGSDQSNEQVKDSLREPQEAKRDPLTTKRLKYERSGVANPVNTQDTKSKSLPGNETSLSKSTKQQPKKEIASGTSSKGGPQGPLDDQEDAETPLDDKRLPRTLFVGNVPQTADRKEIRKIFAKFGSIESIRIRNVIPDNPKIPKKAALLAKRLASFSNSFSAYVVFKEVPDMDKVLQSAVNGTNMTIFQDHHLRVTKALQTKGKRRLSVFIGNLPFDCSDEELISAFMPIAKECGANLLNVRVTRDKDTGVGRGVGFVAFDDMVAIQACMNKAGEITVRGRVLRIERAFKSKMRKSKTYKRNKKAAFKRKR